MTEDIPIEKVSRAIAVYGTVQTIAFDYLDKERKVRWYLYLGGCTAPSARAAVQWRRWTALCILVVNDVKSCGAIAARGGALREGKHASNIWWSMVLRVSSGLRWSFKLNPREYASLHQEDGARVKRCSNSLPLGCKLRSRSQRKWSYKTRGTHFAS